MAELTVNRNEPLSFCWLSAKHSDYTPRTFFDDWDGND